MKLGHRELKLNVAMLTDEKAEIQTQVSEPRAQAPDHLHFAVVLLRSWPPSLFYSHHLPIFRIPNRKKTFHRLMFKGWRKCPEDRVGIYSTQHRSWRHEDSISNWMND
jgi:hypothetical protein